MIVNIVLYIVSLLSLCDADSADTVVFSEIGDADIPVGGFFDLSFSYSGGLLSKGRKFLGNSSRNGDSSTSGVLFRYNKVLSKHTVFVFGGYLHNSHTSFGSGMLQKTGGVYGIMKLPEIPEGENTAKAVGDEIAQSTLKMEEVKKGLKKINLGSSQRLDFYEFELLVGIGFYSNVNATERSWFGKMMLGIGDCMHYKLLFEDNKKYLDKHLKLGGFFRLCFEVGYGPICSFIEGDLKSFIGVGDNELGFYNYRVGVRGSWYFE